LCQCWSYSFHWFNIDKVSNILVLYQCHFRTCYNVTLTSYQWLYQHWTLNILLRCCKNIHTKRGQVCDDYWKSPPKTTTLPPNGEYGRYMMSRQVRSIASTQCQCYAEASSQTINFVSQSNLAELFYTSTEHIKSLLMAIRILKTECEVHPPSNRRAAMREEATLMAMCPSRRIDANNTLYTKVLPDPPKPSRKNITPSP
jgi:hypothetical protein